MKKIENSSRPASQGWVRPEVKRLEAGAAESRDGTLGDGSGQQLS